MYCHRLIGSLFLLAAAQIATPAELAGDYAGWAYLHAGGDFPLRFRCTQDQDGFHGWLTLPHQREFELPVADVRLEADTLTFTRRSSSGKCWSCHAKANADSLAGEIQIDGDDFASFEVCRAAIPLPPRPPGLVAQHYAGLYRDSQGRAVVISAWPWDELRFFDLQSGRSGTLFTLSQTEFFAGSANYVPTTVFARLQFELDDGGSARQLAWTPGDGPRQVLKREPAKEEPIVFRNGDVELRGTLIRPPGRSPRAAIVVLGGSDWQTRGSGRREADVFAGLGLAALIFDHRGCGESTGDAICSFANTAADAAAAVQALKGLPDIRPDAIGVFGRSRGGWFAPLAAARSPDIRFMIIFVPPAISPAAQETTRRLNAFRQTGATEADLAEARAYLNVLWAGQDSDEAWERYVAARDRIEAKGWGQYLEGLAGRDTDDARWTRLNMQYDPRPALAACQCPALAVFGAADRNVVPEENVPLLERYLRDAGNRDVTIRILPRANHGLQLIAPDGTSPPLHRSIGYAPELWSVVRDWLREHDLAPAE